MFKRIYIIFSSIILLSASLFSIELNNSLYGNATLLSEIFIKRHSGTHYLLHPLSEDHIQALIQSARWSPSSYNDQPWNFIFCDRFRTPDAYLKALDCIYGQDWLENVPLFVITVVRPQFLHNEQFNDWAAYDTGAAAMSMSLQAVEMGLVAHQIGGFDREQVQQDFHLPDGYFPLSIIAIGYENPDESSEEPRERRPHEENFFMGKWGKPYIWSHIWSQA